MERFKLNKDKKLLVVLGALFLLIVLSVVLYRCSNLDSLYLNNEEYAVIRDNYTVSYNNEIKEVRLPFRVDQSAYDTVIERKFSKEELKGDYLLFYAYNPTCVIYVDGTPVLQEKNEKQVLNLAPPSHWYCIKVPQKDFVLTVQMHDDAKISTIFEMYSGDKAALVFYILRHNLFLLFISVIILLAGIGLTGASFFIKGKHVNRLRWLGLISLDSGIWVYSLSSVSQLFLTKTEVVSFLEYYAFYMLPLLVTGFVLTFDTFYKQRYMRGLFWGETAVTGLAFLLQFTGISSWITNFYIVHLEVVLIIAGIIFNYIRMWHAGTLKGEDRNIYYALLIIGAFICVDIVRYYVAKPAGTLISFSVCGLVVLLLYLTYSVVKMIRENSLQEAKNSVYRELAFKDIMTQLENRSAYELKLEEFRKSGRTEGMLLIADLNNLKKINDTYGHSYGDDAIIRTASLLKEVFARTGSCYRTGGDEFCVIATEISPEKFRGYCGEFLQKVEEQAAGLNYPYSVAAGVGKIDEKGIDACVKQVDGEMYQDKQASHKGRIN